MKQYFTFFFVFIVTLASGQTHIRGTVTDGKTPIPGANITLQNTYDGTSTDAQGQFAFATTETGTFTIVASFVGYKEYHQTITLNGQALELNMVLTEQINELEAVTITAGAFTASDASRRTVFRALDIATTAGATADIAGALNTLPGTQKVGESGRLFVRGGDGTETRTFIDGLVVLDAYGPSAPNTPSRGRFLPFMFKGTSFSTGGYSAEYGQALSSALALDSKDQGDVTRTDIGLLSVGADVAHTHVWARSSIAGKLQYTNIRPYFGLINQEIDWRKPPVSLEGSGAFRQQIGHDGLLKVYGNFNRANFSLYNHDIDNDQSRQLYDLTNGYQYLNAFYKQSLNDAWTVRGGASYTGLRNEIMAGTTNILEQERGIHTKAVFEGSITEQVELKTGAEVIARTYTYNVTPAGNNTQHLGFDDVMAAAFAEADLYASNKFVTRAGTRLEYNSMRGQVSLDPRLSLAYKTGAHAQMSLAYGHFRQTVRNEWLRYQTQLKPEQADHYILNYQHVDNNRTFRAELYYKRYNQLTRYSNNDLTTATNSGNGYARGFELFWRDNRSVRYLDYWLSYSFLDTKRNYLNFPYAAVPTFASRHNISVVGKYFIQKIKSQLGATFSISSGRPYHNPNAEGFNAARTPVYQDLSFNWSYLPKPHLIVYFSCTNVLGHDNIFGYQYSTVPNAEGLYNGRPTRQAAPRFIFLGVFITLSKEKTMNQLPSL